MNNVSDHLQWSVESPLEVAAALLLSAIFVGSVFAAWQRLGDSARTRWSGVAVLNAVACLAIFALLAPPGMLRPASDAITLVTAGSPSSPDAIANAYVAPGAGDHGRAST